jgi:hypothetical protein
LLLQFVHLETNDLPTRLIGSAKAREDGKVNALIQVKG